LDGVSVSRKQSDGKEIKTDFQTKDALPGAAWREFFQEHDSHFGRNVGGLAVRGVVIAVFYLPAFVGDGGFLPAAAFCSLKSRHTELMQ